MENIVNQAVETSTNIANQAAVAAAGSELNFIQELAKFMDDGGIFMWIILGMWAVGVAIAIERMKSLLSYDTDGVSIMNNIKKHVLMNEVQTAIENCSSSKSLLTGVMKNGLKRANQNRMQIQDALEASILEAIPKAETRLSYLSLIANVSTLVGLLGTIYGLIQSFAAVASADPSAKAELLALGISKAMNTTAFGLISAISIMAVHSYLAGKAEKIIAELEQYSVKLIDLLGTKKNYVSEKTDTAA